MRASMSIHPTRVLFCLFVASSFVLLLSALGARGQVIKGGGGEVGLSAYGVRGVTYRYVTDQIVWLYHPFLNASEGLETYNSGALDFLSLDAPVPGLPERQLLLPLMAGAIAITYNLPPSTSNGTSSQGISLVLDRRLLARIWLGEVSQWSHPDIARLNPELVPLPDEEIRLAWLPGLGVTQVFAHALASFIRDDDPAAADELSANGTLAYLPPVVDPTRGSEGFNTTDRLLAYMNETPFSLGYFVHDSYYTALSPSIAQLVNKANKTVGPAPANIKAAMDDFSPSGQSTNELPEYIVDGHGPESYPLCLFSFIIQDRHIDNAVDCGGSSLHIDNTVWSVSNPQTNRDLESVGYAQLSAAYRIRVLNWLALLTCNNESRLRSSLIAGTGPDAPFVASLGLFYSRTVDRVESQYIPDGGQQQLESGDVDYSVTVYAGPPPADRPDFRYLPIAAFGLSIGYNLPGAAVNLSLSLPVLAGIYMGNITSWRDESIINLNRQSAGDPVPWLLDEKIVVVVDQSGSYNYPFTQALAHASPDFKRIVGVGANVTFPLVGARYVAQSDIGVEVDNTPYGLAFAPQFKFSGVHSASWGNQANDWNGGLRHVSEAQLVNAAESVLAPTTKSVCEAMEDVPLDQYFYADLSLSQRSTSWPLASYYYVLLSKDSYTDCSRATNLVDMVWWTVSSKQARHILNISDLVPVGKVVRGKVLDELVQIKCDGKAVSSLRNCVRNGTLCSDAGECQNNRCICSPERTGEFCDELADDDADALNAASIAAIAACVLIGACVAALAIVACAFLIVLAITRKRNGEDTSWLIDASELDMGELLGTGGFGRVNKAVWRGTEVAVKTMSAAYSPERHSAFIEEVRTMTSLRHPHVVLFMAAATRPPNLCIVMELMLMGSLHDLLHNESIDDIPIKMRLKLLKQAAKGLYFLHSSGIVHRDLKSPNLLLDSKWKLKVSDFGLTGLRERLEIKEGLQMDQGRSVHWTAPEVLNESRGIDLAAADVYSFGIIMWEVFTRQDPYADMQPAAVAVAVLRDGLRPKVPQSAPTDYVELMQEAWDGEPRARPSIFDISNRLSRLATRFKHSRKQVSWLPLIGSEEEDEEIEYAHQEEHSSNSSVSSRGSSLGALLLDESAVPAPTGEVAIVFSDIMRAAALWDFNPEAMRDATFAHNELLRRRLREFEGYEVICFTKGNSGEGSMCAAFGDVAKAVAWCARVQQELMQVEWPEALLKHPEAREERSTLGQLIYRGPRVRMGVHMGEPRRRMDSTTRRVEFTGPVVNTAAHITTMARGGQVLVSETVWLHLAAGRDAAHDAKSEEEEDDDDDDDDRHERALMMRQSRWAPVGQFEVADHQDDGSGTLYGLRVPGLESRFAHRARADDQQQSQFEGSAAGAHSPARGSQQRQRHPDQTSVYTDDAFLVSANLCRWIIATEEIELGSRIGGTAGTYGVVHLGRWKGIKVAVKHFINQKLSERRLLEFRTEAAFLADLSHPNLLHFIGACVKQPNLCVVTEYMKHGSLQDVLRATKNNARGSAMRLSWRQRLGLLHSAAQGLSFLHALDPPVVHGNVKPSNLLLDDAAMASVKVCDFGFARLRQENATMTRCSKPSWTAPEIIRGEPHVPHLSCSPASDVYSMGVVMWEVLTRRQPFAGQNFMGVSLDVLNGKRPPMPSDCPPAFGKMVRRCWHATPRKRPAMSELAGFLAQQLALELGTDPTHVTDIP